MIDWKAWKQTNIAEYQVYSNNCKTYRESLFFVRRIFLVNSSSKALYSKLARFVIKRGVLYLATIAFFNTETWEPAYVRRHIGALFGHKLHFFPEALTEKHIAVLRDVDVISVFIQSKITADIIRLLPNLKMIALRSTGFDNTDIVECARHGITVCNVPAYGDNTVAEHAFALLLCLARHIHTSVDRDKDHDFTIKDLVGFDLKRKTIGIVGGGRIGMNVAKIAHGFGMRVLVYDKFHNNFYTDILDFEYAELDRIYKESDIITLHVPFTPQTRHLIDKRAVKQMKRGVIILNTARGALIDTDALLYGLDNGIIAKAGLDVLEEEEYLTHPHSFSPHDAGKRALLQKNLKLIEHPNIIYTPHNAFNTKEALERIEAVTLGNIQAFLRGRVENQVKP